MKVFIKYKSIIKYEDYQETIEYDAPGQFIGDEEEFEISFKIQGNSFKIARRAGYLLLTNNDSLLQVGEEELLNDYQTPYGTLELVTQLEKYNFSKGTIRFKYALWQNEVKVNDIFVIVNIIEKDEPDENI